MNHWIPFILICLGLAVVLGYIILRKHDTWWQKITLLAAWVYAAFICRICFAPVTFPFTFPNHIHYYMIHGIIVNIVPFQEMDMAFWMNVVMTIPAGVFYALIIKPNRWYSILLLGVCTGLTIETTQFIIDFFVHLGRWVETDDVITNAAGVWIGMLAIKLLTWTPLRKLVRLFEVK